MFGSLRSLWVFVDPTSKESNQNLVDTCIYKREYDMPVI